MKEKSNPIAAKEKALMAQRIERLGIPETERTESVTLAVSALLENLDDTTRELARIKDNLMELERLVDVDTLAPVPNRRAFMRRLTWAISMFERYGHPCSILYLDLNNFKHINDTYGHAAGDEVIRHMSEILLGSLRGSDFTARLGGDEFGIILYYAPLDGAHELGRKIADRLLRSPAIIGARKLQIVAACGAYQVGSGDSPEAALARADAEMYLDKKRLKEHAADTTA